MVRQVLEVTGMSRTSFMKPALRCYHQPSYFPERIAGIVFGQDNSILSGVLDKGRSSAGLVFGGDFDMQKL